MREHLVPFREALAVKPLDRSSGRLMEPDPPGLVDTPVQIVLEQCVSEAKPGNE